ncbi:MAG: hypothetical protein H7Y12_02965 [Sphingobacteriaceae bacterium]|nr:hypothetical protein [Cytophagaceae bacterium]
MLERVKTSLRAVGHDRAAFETRLRQALAQLPSADRRDLKRWCFLIYGESYFTVLCQCFADLNTLAG